MIDLMSGVFTNGPADRGSIPGRVIPKTQDMVLDAALLTLITIKRGSRVKFGNLGNGVASFPTPRCDSYRKGTFGVLLD